MNDANHPLIEELFANPRAFKERGRAYQLLEAYFDGLPLETLRPLFRHRDRLVQHAAVWVASELGKAAAPLLDDVIPLFDIGDRFLSYHVLEIASVCATDLLVDRFVLVPRALEDQDEIIRVLAMRLLTRAAVAQLEAAARLSERISAKAEVHLRGLNLLLGELHAPDQARLKLEEADPIARMYAAILAVRRMKGNPDLLIRAQELWDPAVSRFAREAASK